MTRFKTKTESSLPVLIACRICHGRRLARSAASLTVTKYLLMALQARSTSWKTFLQWGVQNTWFVRIGVKAPRQCRQAGLVLLSEFSGVATVSTAGKGIRGNGCAAQSTAGFFVLSS